MKKVFIYSNNTAKTRDIRPALIEKLNARGIVISPELSNDIDLIFCIGGDGTFLSLMQNHQFPTVPICGINSGHLGFFQEVTADRIDEFLEQFVSDKITTQPYNIVKATIEDDLGIHEYRALNEFALKCYSAHAIHLNVSINNSFIEKFSGDGICVNSPAGSTGYNYSLGGSIVDPRLNIIQVTPISPMNNSVYRSFTSGILLPADDKLTITPADHFSAMVRLQFDGIEIVFENITKATFNLSRRKINLVRFSDNTFWETVKEKFL